MSRTSFERMETPSEAVAAFGVTGKLGFHENGKMEQLVAECLKRGFERVVFDFSGLSSLGGGVARILRSFVKEMEQSGRKVCFVVSKDVVLDFLRDGDTPIRNYGSLEEAMRGAGEESEREEGPGAAGGTDPEASGEGESVEDARGGAEGDGVILMSYDSYEGSAPGQGRDEPAPSAECGTASGDGPEAHEPRDVDGGVVEPDPAGTEERDGLISSIFEENHAPNPEAGTDEDGDGFSLSEMARASNEGELSRKLKRRILELKTLFAISTDFNAIRDRKKLLEIFLLTSIAQGGVESAVFYEKNKGIFAPVLSKGLDEDRLPALDLTTGEEEAINRGRDVISLDDTPVREEIRRSLSAEGIEYICPFSRDENVDGLVMLGRRIAGRGMQKEDFEFMKVLVNIARGAYRNALMFEKENDRTLGIVKTLISLIEENTLLKGTSEFVSRYVGMVAKNMNYPEEHFKDLVYGTVLRDMGMIKVSDLIVRSPRELTREEWEIIKRHPEDGAGMLRRMQFNDHVVEIVLCHHERFNGEGYPRGLRGKDIPLGARIISVVESYAAMINERPNRPALSGREALDTLRENYGLRYDREVVKQFAMIIEKEIAKSVKPAASLP